MENDFYTDQTRHAVENAVKAVEARTAAEVVVTLKQRAGEYLHADLACGAAAAFLTLLVLLFYPRDFKTAAMPFDVLAMFVLGALASRSAPPLRRLFSSAAYRKRQVAVASRAAFVDLAVGSTRGRTGVLVYVALLEREVAIVCDIGLNQSTLAPSWKSAVLALEDSVRQGNASAFVFALGALAPALEAALPRAADDVDELENAPTFG